MRFLDISLVLTLFGFVWGDDLHPVTYGSVIQLVNKQHGRKLFAPSGLSWGTGSGQQAVTADKVSYDSGALWLVKEGTGHAAQQISAGQVIKCKSIIRLENIDIEKNLHAHLVRSPVSSQNEVSAYGEGDFGDTGDNFEVDCIEDKVTWHRQKPIRLRHVDIGGYLVADKKNLFTPQNCPRCPIIDHAEVSVSKSSKPPTADSAKWIAVEGIQLSKEVDDNPKGEKKHDEL